MYDGKMESVQIVGVQMGVNACYHGKIPLILLTGPGATPSMSIAVTERVWRVMNTLML